MQEKFPSLLLIAVLISFLSSVGLAQPEFFAKIRALNAEGKQAAALQLVTQQLASKDLPKDNARLLLMEKALIERDLAQWDNAISDFQSLLGPESGLGEYAYFETAQIELKQAQADETRKEDLKKEALKNFKAILKLSPNMKMQRDVQFQIAKLENASKQYREARTILNKMEKKNRFDEIYPELLTELARAERGTGNNSGFCKWIKKLYTHYPDDVHVVNWGFQLKDDVFDDKPTHCVSSSEDRRLRIKNLQWAGLNKKAQDEIELLKTGTREDQSEALDLQISYLLHDGEIEKAVELLKPMYESKKSDPNFLMIAANAAAKMGDSEAAIGSYYAAYKLNPRGKLGKQALFQAAFMSYQFQDYDGASRKFQEFMKAFSGSALGRDAKWHLAWIRYLRGDYEGALKAFADLNIVAKKTRRSKVAKVSVSSDRVNYWIAMCLYRTARYSDARVIFENLSRDKLLGYYALASMARLKKLDELMPKAPQRLMPDENRRISRFSSVEAVMPADDPAWFREVANQKAEVEDINRSDDPNVSQVGEEAEAAQEALPKEEGPDRGVELGDAAQPSPDIDEDRPSPFTNPMLLKRFERARDLMILGLQDWSRWDLFDIEKKTSNRDYLKTLMQEYELVETYNRSSYIGQVTFGGQRAFYGMEGSRPLWEHTYPRAYAGLVNRYSREFSVPTELIWGIMRAESQYKRDVISPVGALGLMQVMPFTAQKIAGLLSEKDFDPKKLLFPDGAIRIGSKYLSRLLKKFDGNMALVAAGYNAGPHRVKSWVASFGQLDMDEFIEHIPYLETRNYVKKVLTHFLIYSKLYAGKKEGMVSLSEPLGGSVSDSIVSKENFHETMKESWDDI